MMIKQNPYKCSAIFALTFVIVIVRKFFLKIRDINLDFNRRFPADYDSKKYIRQAEVLKNKASEVLPRINEDLGNIEVSLIELIKEVQKAKDKNARC